LVTHAAHALFTWPLQTSVARPVAKAKIYAHAKPTAALRALFVEQVESITWACKLAPETINLPAKPDVPEIEVFEIALKLPDLNHAVLRCLSCGMTAAANPLRPTSAPVMPPIVQRRKSASGW
jgi:Domain of unknown function (DUF4391)